MDQKQLEKKVTWLDKQRQKDAEIAARAQERIEATAAAVDGLSLQVKELTSELTRLSAAIGKLGELEDTMVKHRQEISRLVGKDDARRTKKDEDRDSRQKSEREQLAKVSFEIKEGLRDLKELKEGLEERKEEGIRIMRKLTQLEEGLQGQELFDEEKARSLASLEEGRKHDAKRLTDINSETAELGGKLELVRSNLESLDDRLARNEMRVTKVAGGENERRESQELWMEQQVARLVEFEREWKSWGGRFEQFEQRAADIDQRTLTYDETYRTLRHLQSELEAALGRLDRRIHEISEMQRLAEDRATQEWSAFQADEQKRWNTHKLTNDERWREHSRAHEKLVAEVSTLGENVKELMLGFGEMQENDRQRILGLLASIREWAADLDSRPRGKP